MNYGESPQLTSYKTTKDIVDALIDRDVNYTRYDNTLSTRFGVGQKPSQVSDYDQDDHYNYANQVPGMRFNRFNAPKAAKPQGSRFNRRPSIPAKFTHDNEGNYDSLT